MIVTEQLAAWLRDAPGMFAVIARTYGAPRNPTAVYPLATYRLNDDLHVVAHDILTFAKTDLDAMAWVDRVGAISWVGAVRMTLYRVAVRATTGHSTSVFLAYREHQQDWRMGVFSSEAAS